MVGVQDARTILVALLLRFDAPGSLAPPYSSVCLCGWVGWWVYQCVNISEGKLDTEKLAFEEELLAASHSDQVKTPLSPLLSSYLAYAKIKCANHFT